MSALAWTHTAAPQRLHAGPRTVERLSAILRELGLRRLALITTASRAASDDGVALVRRLGRSVVEVYEGARPHTPAATVQEAVGAVRRAGVDGIVSFGGGSCTDLAKAVAFFLDQEGGAPGASYADRPTLPHVAIPTTYCGAEHVAGFAVLDERTGAKANAAGANGVPIAVIHDPLLTMSLSPMDTAASAIDALGHAVEVAYATDRSPEAEVVALAAVGRIAASLPAAFDQPDDVEARAELLAGAALAGRARQNATPGALHGLSQVLGGRTRMAHAVASELLVAAVVRYNAGVVPEAMAKVAAALGACEPPAGEDAAAAIDRLCDRLTLPRRFNEPGVGVTVSDDDIDAVARMAQANSAVQANPRPMGEDDAWKLLRTLL